MPNDNMLTQMLARCRSGFVAVAGFSLIINLLVLSTSVYMLQVYDRVLPGRSVETLVYLTLIATGALAAMGALELFRSRLLVRLGVWIDRVLSPQVLGRSLENALRGIPYRTEGLRDLATLRGYLGGGGIMALFDAPWMPIYLVFIFLLHPLLGLLALGGAVVLFCLALANNALTAVTLKQANMASARAYQGADAAFRNAEVVDGMGMGGALMQRWDTANAHVLSLQSRASDRAGLISAFTKPFRMFLQVAVLGLGAWLSLRHEVSPGAMIAASIIMSRALAPVEQAIATWKQTTGAREAWGRLNRLFEAPQLRPAGMELPRPQGQLAVEAVTYSPTGSRGAVLRNVTFSLSPGNVLAVIGPSAAGKSTLARLIVGMASPQHGQVRLDGADVFSWNRTDFGRHVGYLPQDVELFPGSIRENIARMEEGDPAAVVIAAKMAGVHEMILRLPRGYDTDIGEHGSILSGGQRQRIGLARALYGRPALVVLDEPNSSLDAAGEEALNQAIAAVKEAGSTVVIIAHRPSLMAHVDSLLVLNEGQTQMFGPRDAVLAQLRRPEPSIAAPQVRVVSSERSAS
ncbi:type I secretion system permease/ATPase [Mesorhizobium sp. B2-4-14]|uniref:type I secretion system permease/ATPase n=1 Tax=Mesorhizobium sp. B2-4-14 TaxID=2589935 RepID=UPI0011292B45|nr:type I secretion system permease/ATPase [Mesorhizobium sp. B2-4-14]TPL10211.1 type I secretion system permease/ATPase [Mesorhizobium sp. B2-4-14]